MKIYLLIAADRLHRWFNNLLIGRDEFCTQCNGPYTGWLRQYGGHWDTCANRERTKDEKDFSHRCTRFDSA